MCGISGWFIPRSSDKQIGDAEYAEFQRWTHLMAHRGPDDSGFYLSPDRRCAFGHRRLSIIDLSTGHQPIFDESGGNVLIHNGEIYNYRELRADLETRGHRFSSATDSETIVHLYEDLGPDSVCRLDGMFALAVYDSKNHTLLLARDFVGKKPLYYMQLNGQFFFASEMKTLLEHPDMRKEIDPAALSHYLTFSCVPAPHAFFRGIRKLRCGERLIVSADGSIRSDRYADISRSRVDVPEDEQEICDRIIHLLRESIRKRMISDVPFGVFLSGGTDSSTNVALMAELMDRPVTTFSVGIRGQESFSEFKYSKLISERYGTDHHEIVIDDGDFLDYFDSMAWHQDEPLADPVCVPLHYLSKLTRDSGTIVIQVGEGSDELFAGYNGYVSAARAMKLLNAAGGIVPRPLRGMIAGFAPRARREVALRWARGVEPFWGAAVAFKNSDKSQMINTAHPLWNTPEAVPDSGAVIDSLLEDECDPGGDALRRLIYIEMRNRLPELLLMRVDKITMGNSIEARVPFLDRDLAQFVFSLPEKIKIRNNVPKYILKRALEPILPKEIIYRPKIGFCGSTANMLHGEIMPFTKNLVLNETPVFKDLFNMDFIKNMFANPETESFRVWNLLNLALWWKCWMS